MLFSSRTASRDSPGSPSSAKPGALRREFASAALPSPPLPPRARTTRVPTPMRSATTSPSTDTTVPSGTRRTRSSPPRDPAVPAGTRSPRSSPRPPFLKSPAACLPLPAFWCGAWWKSSSVCTLGSTSRTTSPPSPPLPPSGPPSGLNFSRWTELTPWDPFPAATWTVTRSTKAAMIAASLRYGRTGWNGNGVTAPCRRCHPVESWVELRRDGLAGRDGGDGDLTTPTAEPEGHRAGDEGEQRVVLAAADAQAGVEVGAALADDDLAGLDDLATEALHAEALGVRVAAVTGRRCALLVCHVVVSPS